MDILSNEMTNNSTLMHSEEIIHDKTPTDCLFVGDLGRFCSEIEIENIFGTIGTVTDVTIKKSKKDGSSLGYGFVRMATLDQAIQAMKVLNGTILCGRPMRIRWGVHKAEVLDNDLDHQGKGDSINSIYVRYKTLKVSILSEYL